MSDAARGQRVTSAKNVLMSCLHSTAMASAEAGLHTFILLPVLLFHATGRVFILLGEILAMLILFNMNDLLQSFLPIWLEEFRNESAPMAYECLICFARLCNFFPISLFRLLES